MSLLAIAEAGIFLLENHGGWRSELLRADPSLQCAVCDSADSSTIYTGSRGGGVQKSEGWRAELARSATAREGSLLTGGEPGGWQPLCRHGAKPAFQEQRPGRVMARTDRAHGNSFGANMELSSSAVDFSRARDSTESAKPWAAAGRHRVGRPHAQRGWRGDLGRPRPRRTAGCPCAGLAFRLCGTRL